MPTTHFTSDTHLHHRLMVILRGFVPADTTKDEVTEEDLARHDESIIDAWNAVVGPADTVWHLGDLTLQRPAAIAHLIARLNGDIRLVLGNHDRAHPLFGSRSVLAHAELHDVGIPYSTMAARVTLRESEHNRIPVLLSHFPYAGDHTFEDRFEQWRLRDVGEILLHGHTHSDRILTEAGTSVEADASAAAGSSAAADTGVEEGSSAEAVDSVDTAPDETTDAEARTAEPPRRGTEWDRQIHVGWEAWGRPVSEDEIVELITSQRTGRR